MTIHAAPTLRSTRASRLVGGCILAAAGICVAPRADASALRPNTFQAIDDTTVYVLGSDGKLWREHGSMQSRVLVDANVQSFQALDASTVYVLGSDGNLWRERGTSASRDWIDGSVLRFQGVNAGLIYVLGSDGTLWREHGTSATRDRIDANVRAFRAQDPLLSATDVYVLGTDGNLWREHGNMQTRDWVDAGVVDFQTAYSTTDVDVLGADGNLWKEHGDMHDRSWVDGNVQSFQDAGGSQYYVLGTDGNLWRESVNALSRSKVDGAATSFQAAGSAYPGLVYVLGADGKLWREHGDSTHRDSVDAGVSSSRVMANPEVVLILWGHDYINGSTLAQQTGQLFSDLVTGPYMEGMAQYGVARGAIVSTVVIDEPLPPAGTRPIVSGVAIQNKLLGWIGAGTVRKPSINDTDVLYFIVPPAEYELYLDMGNPTNPTPGTQGFHVSTKYNAASTQNDVLWSVVKTYHPESVPQFLQTSDVIAHELVEAFNDPLGGRVELGDMCDGQENGPGFPDYTYLGKWSVPLYWSTRANACIHGETP